MEPAEVAREVARVTASDVQHDLLDRQRRAVQEDECQRHPPLSEVLRRRPSDAQSKQVREPRRRQARLDGEAGHGDVIVKMRVDVGEGAFDAGVHVPADNQDLDRTT